MNFIKQIERLQILNKLIIAGNTGTPDELADRLKLSRSRLYEIIDMLKIHGAPISYSRKLRTFYYAENYSLEIKFQLKILTCNEEKRIFGGLMKVLERKIFPSDETGRNNSNFGMQTYTSHSLQVMPTAL